MHEFSLVRALLSQVGDLLRAQGGEGVEAIRVELGPLSGVEPELLALAFEQSVGDTPCVGARLQLELVPLICQCDACRRRFEPVRFRFRCPTCGGVDVRVTSGEELRLVDVTIRLPATQPATSTVTKSTDSPRLEPDRTPRDFARSPGTAEAASPALPSLLQHD